MVFCSFLFFTVKNCKLPQLREIWCIKLCFYEFLRLLVRDVSGIYSSAEQFCVVEPGDAATISAVGVATLPLYRAAEQHPEMHSHLGTWALILHHSSCVPGSSIRCAQSVHVCSTRTQAAGRNGPHLLGQLVLQGEVMAVTARVCWDIIWGLCHTPEGHSYPS